MLKYYLDKTGKVIKSILFPSSEFVDTEPREGSLNPLASGAVANVMPQDATKDNPLMTAEDTERMIDAMKPIDTMTLRFEFSKKDYNPSTAGVGSAGTWTKVDSPTLNIWDWKNTNTDWSDSFKGAFPDADNEVRVIAAGDTSSVTNFKDLFSGTWTSTPTSSAYTPTVRNNIVSCVPFNIDSATILTDLFCSTALKEYVQFDYSNNAGADAPCMFADTLIEDIGDIALGVKKAGGMFTQNDKLKKIGNISFDSSKLDGNTPLNLISFSSRNRETNILEEVGNITGTENVKSFSTIFQSCAKLKRIGSIDCSSATSFRSMFSHCHELENVPLLENVELATVTDTASMFSNCYKLKNVPLFDTSDVTDATSMLLSCYAITEIPDYDFSSVTKVTSFCRNCYHVSKRILETYNKFLDRGSSITAHDTTFDNCGRDTPQGRLALAQIPQSWGGLAEG